MLGVPEGGTCLTSVNSLQSAFREGRVALNALTQDVGQERNSLWRVRSVESQHHIQLNPIV